jgi:hypothetical protein
MILQANREITEASLDGKEIREKIKISAWWKESNLFNTCKKMDVVFLEKEVSIPFL